MRPIAASPVIAHRPVDDRLAAKRRRLQRMRMWATGLLIGMVGLLIGAVALEPRYPLLVWLEAFAEAAVVGAVADWFAVVALFRHPLGLPIPHTAIVPRNKDRIGGELGRFVERNFLTPENIAAKLIERDPIGHAMEWLAEQEHSRDVAASLREFLPRLLDAVDDVEIERLIAAATAERIAAIDLARASSGLLALVTSGGRHQEVLDQILRRVGVWLDLNREMIKQKFGEQSAFTPRFVDTYIVNRFVDGIIDLIGEVAMTPDHELRHSFDAALRSFILRLRFEPRFRAKAETLKRELLASLKIDEFIRTLWAEVKRQLLADATARDSVIEVHLAQILQRLSGEIRRDRALIDRLNRGLVDLVEAGLLRFRDQISGLIEEVVRRWNARDVTEKIELEVGSDLQFIRLNGTFVGGAIGLALHAGLTLSGLR
jgi:uncharacterized membrane-anchored protein YjiN (DUF445 family)